MQTKVIKIGENDANIREKLLEPANIIKNGGLVVMPTETVYGLGANALDEDKRGMIERTIAKEKRIAASPEFKAINRRIKMFRDQRNKKSVSLNETKRWRDYQQEKIIADAEKKELGLKEGAKKEKLDPATKEAAAIAADLYDLMQGK